MVKNHSKRIAVKKTWDIKRKEETFITKANPGAHSKEFGFPLIVVIRDLLKLADTRKETRDILLNQEVLVDGVKRKDHKFCVGLMDVISFPKLKKHYRIILNIKGKLALIEIDAKEANQKLARIKKKVCLGKKFQLTFADGTTILTDKNDYKVNDTLLLELPKKEIKDHFKFEKGNSIMLVGGKHIGLMAGIEEISSNGLTLKTESGDVFDTSKKHAYVIGKSKPCLKLN